MAVLLDTDNITILQRRIQPECSRLQDRLDQLPPDDIGTTIVTFQEQVWGWMTVLNRADRRDEVVRAYRELETVLRHFSKLNVVSFTAEAEERYNLLRKQRVRIGTMDLRIAAIALVTDSTVLSRNLVDFRKVPGLSVEDWTL